ncbi:FAR1-related sequence 10 [Tanacetum coccineum]|uniref:FAR1-related sequence 10 n=1 Tax=Tanacetum coccineum TaxID=301880 RepID=A0ABQ5HZL5_9ASTR
MMYVYVEKVEKTKSSSDEEGEGDSESEDGNDFVDEEHLLDEVEVNMSSFKFQIDGEDDTELIDHIQPNVNVIEDDLEVLDFDLLKSDQDDENARNTTVKIDVYGEEDLEKTTRMFRRIYVCLGALKRGFKEGGRELLGLDGAFMRGQYPGQMLTALGVDANNGIYPVAYGIVESENQYSWTWFLKCLADDFDLFMIEKNDGALTPAVIKLFNKIKEAASECTVDWNGSDLFQVKGITCKHAIVAIHDMADNGMDVGTPED